MKETVWRAKRLTREMQVQYVPVSDPTINAYHHPATKINFSIVSLLDYSVKFVNYFCYRISLSLSVL
jgi:hypothetical protein